MAPRTLLIALSGLAAAFLGLAWGAAAAGPDLHADVALEPASGSGPLVAAEALRAVALLSNVGNQDAGAFEVEILATDGHGAALLGRHSLNVSALAAGANVSLADPMEFTVALAGDIQLSIVADPAHRVNDTRLSDNLANRTVYVGPAPATETVERLDSKVSANRTLPPYSYLAFEVTLRDGDSLIFQADAVGGALFDCYLLEASNFTRYEHARESNLSVSFVRDYSRTSTDHLAYTAEPLPPGTYYLVLENDERLSSGASPQGPVTVNFAIAIVNNSLPAWAVIVVIGAAAAAIWATVKWRPHFDVRSPLLAVPPPEPEEYDGEGEPPGPPPGLLEDEAAERREDPPPELPQ